VYVRALHQRSWTYSVVRTVKDQRIAAGDGSNAARATAEVARLQAAHRNAPGATGSPGHRGRCHTESLACLP
jgi:hypothetical protein